MSQTSFFFQGAVTMISSYGFSVCLVFVSLISLTCTNSSFLFIIMVMNKSKGKQKSVNGFLCVPMGDSDTAQNQQEWIPCSISKIETVKGKLETFQLRKLFTFPFHILRCER